MLHLADYRRKDGAAASLNRLQFLLSQARTSFPDALYIPDALKLIESKGDALNTELRRRGLYVKFAAAFLRSPTILGIFDRERPAAGGERRRHSQELEFDTYRVDDPIAFLKTYSDETVASAGKALWMLQQLAFAEES